MADTASRTSRSRGQWLLASLLLLAALACGCHRGTAAALARIKSLEQQAVQLKGSEKDIPKAVRLYDRALSELAALPATPENRRLRAHLLAGKADTCLYLPEPDVLSDRNTDRAAACYEEALAVARELTDRPLQADLLVELAAVCGRSARPEYKQRQEKCLLQAEGLRRELGDAAGEAHCQQARADLYLLQGRYAEARPLLEQLLPRHMQLRDYEEAAANRACLDLLADVGEGRYQTFQASGTICESAALVVEEKPDGVAFGPPLRRSPSVGVPPALTVRGLLPQVSAAGKLFDTSLRVGASWSQRTDASDPLQLASEARIENTSMHVTTPAGSFRDCLLVRQTTKGSARSTARVSANVSVKDRVVDMATGGQISKLESDVAQSIADNQMDATLSPGARRALYAPGVGLVRFESTKILDGSAASVHLASYTVARGSRGYFPLAVGNAWVYTWENLPAGYESKEVYRVVARDGDTWYLAYYSYAYPR